MKNRLTKWRLPRPFLLFAEKSGEKNGKKTNKRKTNIRDLQPGDSSAERLVFHCQIGNETERLRIIHYDEYTRDDIITSITINESIDIIIAIRFNER